MLITLFHESFKGQYFLWTPVFFSIGIILYFSLSFEPSGELFKFVPLTALGLGLLLFVRQPNQKYRQIGLSLMIFSGGFLFAQFETFRADSPFLKYPITTDIDAVIEWQEKRVNSSLFILKVLKADKIHPRYRPHRVRVCVKAACYLPIKDKRLAVVYKSSAIAEACAKADMVILATENKNPITCPFVFHRKMSKPGETLFYEFKTGNDIPVHYAGGVKTKKRIWLN